MTLDQILIEAYQQSQIQLGFLPALIGAVATIGGAALSAKAANQPQKTTSEIDYVKMAKQATKAGFNPLTALRAGGGNGFATTTTSGGGASPLGAALSALGQNVGGLLPQQRNDPIVQAGRAKPSTALVDYQLRRATGPTAGRIYPVSTTTGGKVVSSRVRPFQGPPHPRDWVKDAGGYVAYVPVWDQTANRLVLHPNPDGAELEQVPVAPAMLGANAVADTAQGVKDRVKRIQKEGIIRVSPATPEQIKRNTESWHRGWLPSIGWSWN